MMDIYGAKFQEHCFNNFREIVYSVFTTFQLHVVWHHHWSNLHNRKTSISLKRKKIFQKEKRHSSVFWKAFQISRKKVLCHIHFKICYFQCWLAFYLKIVLCQIKLEMFSLWRWKQLPLHKIKNWCRQTGQEIHQVSAVRVLKKGPGLGKLTSYLT